MRHLMWANVLASLVILKVSLTEPNKASLVEPSIGALSSVYDETESGLNATVAEDAVSIGMVQGSDSKSKRSVTKLGMPRAMAGMGYADQTDGIKQAAGHLEGNPVSGKVIRLPWIHQANNEPYFGNSAPILVHHVDEDDLKRTDTLTAGGTSLPLDKGGYDVKSQGEPETWPFTDHWYSRQRPLSENQFDYFNYMDASPHVAPINSASTGHDLARTPVAKHSVLVNADLPAENERAIEGSGTPVKEMLETSMLQAGDSAVGNAQSNNMKDFNSQQNEVNTANVHNNIQIDQPFKDYYEPQIPIYGHADDHTKSIQDSKKEGAAGTEHGQPGYAPSQQIVNVLDQGAMQQREPPVDTEYIGMPQNVARDEEYRRLSKQDVAAGQPLLLGASEIDETKAESQRNADSAYRHDQHHNAKDNEYDSSVGLPFDDIDFDRCEYKETDGAPIFADRRNPGMYITCSTYGTPVRLPCPTSTYFSDNLKTCVPEGFVESSCGNRCANGECIYDAKKGEYACSCNVGYTGDNCTEKIDYCREFGSRCGPGRCINQVGTYVCDCGYGLIGHSCDEANQVPCSTQFVHEGGRLDRRTYHPFGSDHTAYVTCFTKDSFVVRRCKEGQYWDQSALACISHKPSEANDGCEQYPCLFGGQCVPDPDSTTEEKYKCICAPGYFGKNCEYIIDHCKPNPCNGNPCKSLANPPGYYCQCPNNVYDDCCCNDVENRCDTKARGGFYAETDGMFVHCTPDGRAFVKRCPPGFWFDEQKLTCVKYYKIRGNTGGIHKFSNQGRNQRSHQEELKIGDNKTTVKRSVHLDNEDALTRDIDVSPPSADIIAN